MAHRTSRRETYSVTRPPVESAVLDADGELLEVGQVSRDEAEEARRPVAVAPDHAGELAEMRETGEGGEHLVDEVSVLVGLAETDRLERDVGQRCERA